ncbi:protein stum homolog isoform X2 [Kogia breviceps]|uniref:protein stum homolog isoform X2 n=1 Tax=Kogia breviceps TaxID=27615 RepID=UPI0034D2D756
MEPSHKDAETAAAAAAVAAAAAADRGTSSSSGVVVQVREKKGPLRAAIPYMPFPVAVICLFLNTFVPGLGTFVSAFTVLCGARTDLPDRHVCCVFWLNIAAALIQMLTAIVMVGWIMSIFWGMDMVILASTLPFSPHPTLLPCPTPDKTIDRWNINARGELCQVRTAEAGGEAQGLGARERSRMIPS